MVCEKTSLCNYSVTVCIIVSAYSAVVVHKLGDSLAPGTRLVRGRFKLKLSFLAQKMVLPGNQYRDHDDSTIVIIILKFDKY